jgi:hypothetical protein
MQTSDSQTINKALKMDGPLDKDLALWWKEYLAKPKKDRTFDAVFESPMFPLQRKRECSAMLEIIDRTIEKPLFAMMEIGADKGGNVLLWMQRFYPLAMIVSEWRGVPYAGVLKEAYPEARFNFLDNSYDPTNVRNIYSFLDGGKIDVLFLDGDKANFLRDFDCYRAAVSDTGIVFVHDINDKAPTEAYNQLIERGFKHQEITDTSELGDLPEESQRTAYQHWLAHWQGKSCGVGVLYMQKGL